MPTVLRSNGIRFFFYSSENNEPPHIHVETKGPRSSGLTQYNSLVLADFAREN